MPHQHFADEQSRLGVIHLPSVISRINEPFSAVHINGRSGPTERAEEAASQQWRKPFSKTGAVIVHFFNPTLLVRLAIFRLVSTFVTVPLRRYNDFTRSSSASRRSKSRFCGRGFTRVNM